MSNVMTLLRRELGQFFRSPVAYVFLVLFVVFVQIFYVLEVFHARTADLRYFFAMLPWAVVAFSALITMRSWAEERQENTYEMLLTFPMRTWELVVAKFVATYLFLCFGILCTGTLPLMLVVLGEPDIGPICTGYLGAFLLAAMWCSAGVFFSSLTRSQLLAAIVTLVLGLLSLIVGVAHIAEAIDGKVPGLGSVLGSVLGTWVHYDALGRGVLELANVLFFATWVAVFLYLTGLYVGMRRAPRARQILAAGTFLAVGCGLLGARLVADATLARADVTEEGVYTLSQGTVNILRRANTPIRATFYVSPRDDMPAEMQNLERDVLDRLEEMRLQSGGMLIARVVHMKAGNLVVKTDSEQKAEDAAADLSTDDDKSIERRLIEQGIQPFQVQSRDATEVTTKYVYATLRLEHGAKDPEHINPVVPGRMHELEYLIASTAAHLVRDRPPRVALYLGQEEIPPQLRMQYERMGIPIPDMYSQVAQLLESRKFDVARTKLTQHSPMPQEYDAFVAVGPMSWSERARWELRRALASGKPTFLALQRYLWEYEPARGGGIIPRPQQVETGAEEALAPLGIGVSDQILMQAENAESLRVQTDNALQNLMGARLELPTHIGLIDENFASKSAITDRVGSVLYLWGSALKLDREALMKKGFDVTVLAQTNENAWQVPHGPALRSSDFQGDGRERGQYPLIALLEGDFGNLAPSGERPDWPVTVEMSPDGRPLPPPPDPRPPALQPGRGKLILSGSASAFQNGILSNPGNQLLLVNCVSALTLDPDLLEVRSKQPRSRRFSEPSAGTAWLWTLIPLVFVPSLLIGIGLAIGFVRVRARNRWNAEHGR